MVPLTAATAFGQGTGRHDPSWTIIPALHHQAPTIVFFDRDHFHGPVITRQSAGDKNRIAKDFAKTLPSGHEFVDRDFEQVSLLQFAHGG
jgi:hypothetical protein